MRFLFSHRTRSADGQYVHIKALTDALRARGHEIVFAGPEKSSAKKPLGVGRGGGWKNAVPKALYECAEYGYSFLAQQRLAAAIRDNNPDIIYERYNLFYHAGLWAKRRSGLPLILEINAPLAEERARHGGLALKSFARNSEAAIWRAADMTLPVTNALADYVRAAGVAEERIEVIQNGVGDDFLSPRDPSVVVERYGLTGKTVLGFTGFVRDWHRLDRIITFIAGRKCSDLCLLLVGDGPARPALEQLAEDLGVAAQIIVTGVVQRNEIADHVAAFDVALQPAATSYASPLKLFEYMALGRAILAPHQPNISEVLSDGDNALLFNVSEEKTFHDALARLINDQELRERIGDGARKALVSANYTWDGNAARVEQIARRLLEEKV